MSLRNIFTKRNVPAKSEETIKLEDEKSELKEEVKVKEQEKPAQDFSEVKKAEQKKEKTKTKIVYPFVLKSFHISEKAGDLEKNNQYIFKVFLEANKHQIKEAVENIYKVNVQNINIINMPGKKKRLGKYVGKPRKYKKAIIRIKQGQKIEVL